MTPDEMKAIKVLLSKVEKLLSKSNASVEIIEDVNNLISNIDFITKKGTVEIENFLHD